VEKNYIYIQYIYYNIYIYVYYLPDIPRTDKKPKKNHPNGSKARVHLLQSYLLLPGPAGCVSLGRHGLQLVPGGFAHRVQGGDVGRGLERLGKTHENGDIMRISGGYNLIWQVDAS
jgi:hypothetical protein